MEKSQKNGVPAWWKTGAESVENSIICGDYRRFFVENPVDIVENYPISREEKSRKGRRFPTFPSRFQTVWEPFFK